MICWQDFPLYLREVRLQHHLSQQRFAERLGYGRVHINHLKNGKKRPSRMLLRCIAHEFLLTDQQKAAIITYEMLCDDSSNHVLDAFSSWLITDKQDRNPRNEHV